MFSLLEPGTAVFGKKKGHMGSKLLEDKETRLHFHFQVNYPFKAKNDIMLAL